MGQQLPEFYEANDPADWDFRTKERLKQEAWERFRNLELFFVKVGKALVAILATQ